jgi:ABC-type dipeptide/oligopeptide/nickel transport system permease subunit
MSQGDAYLDIVWKQFRKNRPAVVALWILGLLFFVALVAPLIGSNQPLVFHDGEQTEYPWFHALFHPGSVVDYPFNMALLGFIPWLFGALVWNHWAKRRGESGRRRVIRVGCAFLAITAVLSLVFLNSNWCPSNRFAQANFSQNEYDRPKECRGIYALIPFGPQESDLDARNSPPFYRKPKDDWKEANDGFIHLLGTDTSGRDVLVQLAYGTRIALTVGIIAVSIYVTIGVFLGSLAGYFGGGVDMVISRIVEIVLLFPTFFLILTIVGLLGQRLQQAGIEGIKIYIIMLVIGITNWPTIARLTRGEVLKQRAMEYTLSARALGAGDWRIIFRHILPNALAPALVAIPFGIASAIVTEAGLSLLGVGLSPPTPSWGYLLNIASTNYALWWLVVFPSGAIFVTVTVFNLVGSGLRDAMDPRLRM